MFKKVLIANRGAIACRIIRTLNRMGIQSVAVYSEADRHSMHVAQATEAVCVGPAAAAQSYLRADAILEAAKATGAEAIHPGYGFLSENPDFAEACGKAGIVFIGPKPDQMRAFGLKHRARELALAAGVPLAPGSGLIANLSEAEAEAERIGYPVMLKSTAGGGGIGLQLVSSAAELAPLYERVERLARNNFKDPGLFLEKYVARGRHIEVQIFGDGKGRVVALGERDCSAQRRNQKVIEETPAPGLSETSRAALWETACSLGKSVSYESAGTVEFLYDSDTDDFYFLEVNTRLQVEHGVTEEVTGLDLVEWMVRQAAGETLPLDQDRIAPEGASIQVRLYAEDPARDFRPSSGLLSHVAWPKAARIETWVESGAEVSPFYDPMIAKIIVRAGTRSEALSKLRDALDEVEIGGLETNLDYLRQLAASDVLADGQMLTRTLATFPYSAPTIEVLAPGTQTTIQDWPGRTGYWAVGVPPSGPMVICRSALRISWSGMMKARQRSKSRSPARRCSSIRMPLSVSRERSFPQRSVIAWSRSGSPLRSWLEKFSRSAA
jgi:urea carboxylase